jgi:hypothetical protein
MRSAISAQRTRYGSGTFLLTKKSQVNTNKIYVVHVRNPDELAIEANPLDIDSTIKALEFANRITC